MKEEKKNLIQKNLLHPKRYDEEEAAAMEKIPNRIIQCCRPQAFLWENYPTQIGSTSGAARYLDVMQEGRLSQTFNEILDGGVTREEMQILEKVARSVHEFSSENYGKAASPKDSLARSVNVYRHIRMLVPEPPATVFEVGGGSGYVGALLLASGYTYISTDVTQAFYIVQNHIMNAVAPGQVIELALESRNLEDFTELPAGFALHVPWWKFVRPAPKFRLPVSIITANHCLCEMHPMALAYTLTAGKQLLANGGRNGCFAFEGWGSTARNPIWSVNKKFWELGFVSPHNDTRLSTYVADTSPLAQDSAPRRNGVSSAAGAQTRPESFVPKISFSPPNENTYQPHIWITPKNPVSNQIMQGRKYLGRKHRMGDYEQMLENIFGANNKFSDDEVFLQTIGASL